MYAVCAYIHAHACVLMCTHTCLCVLSCLLSRTCACTCAGIGAAWLWQGRGGQGFDPKVMTQLQRFLSSDQPRVKVLGGVR